MAVIPMSSEPDEKTVEIADGAQGYTFDRLFGDHLRRAKQVTVEDPFISRPHQVANFLRLCELLVRLGTVENITLLTKDVPDEAYARLESIRRSLAGFGIKLEIRQDPSLHDRCIRTDTGWTIHLGRGLDLYKRPEDFCAVGATDFALRPCFKTSIVYRKTGVSKAA
jgi:ATP-dependent Lon protease